MTEIATIDWFGSFGTFGFSENTAIFAGLVLFMLIFSLQDLEYRDRLEKAGKVLYALTHETSESEQKEAGIFIFINGTNDFFSKSPTKQCFL